MSKYNSTQTEQIKEIGNYLRQQRLKNSLSIEQIASMTFVRLPMLKALEGGQIDLLPELIYVQGFIRRYGEALQLDGHSLAQQISKSESTQPLNLSPEFVSCPPMEPAGEEPPPHAIQTLIKPSASVEKTSSPSPETAGIAEILKGKAFKVYWVYFLLLGTAITGLFYLFSRPPVPQNAALNQSTPVVNSTQTQPVEPPTVPNNEATTPSSSILEKVPSSESPQTQASVTPSPVSESPQTETSVTPSPVSESPQTEVSVAPSPVSESPQTAPSPPAESAIAPETPAPNVSPSPNTNGNTPVTASIKLDDDSWVQVKVDGKTEYEGIMEKGAQQRWQAKETLLIRAGNAGAVNLSVNNQPAQLLGSQGEVKQVTLTPNQEVTEKQGLKPRSSRTTLY
jgi:cytoskeletal protein RodZ